MEYELKVRILARREVRQLLEVKDVINTVEDTFLELGKGKVFHPVKEPMWLNEAKTNMLLAMPAFIQDKKLAGVKWVSMFKDQKPGFPTCAGTLLVLSSSENGQPYAILEATDITTMRTAGGHGAVAAKYLAKKDSKTLAVIGCGEEAKAGIDALLTLFSLKEIKVFDINNIAMQRLKDYLGKRADVVFAQTSEEAVKNADIVLIVTTSRKPVVMFEWLAKGCTVLGLYSFYDLDPSCSKKADKWVLGSKKTDNHQIVFDPLLKKFNLSMDDVYADLGEIVCGAEKGRENNDEIIVYTCLGMGALDTAVGETIYRRAIEKRVGTVIDLS